MTITAVQTSVTTTPANGVPGAIYDETEAVDIITRRCSVDIPFGAFVQYDADACKLPTASGDVTGLARGVALLDQGKSTTTGYKAGDLVQIMIKGRVWIQAESGQTITAYNVPYARYTANGGLTVGGWRSDTDTGKAAVPNSMHMYSTATSGGLGILQINDVQSGPVGPTA